jgi:hypothetical protein
MRKNKLYIVLVILTITFLFTTAAVCTQCGILGDEGEEAADADNNKKSADTDDSKKSADADDSGKEGESKDTNGDKKDSDKKDEPKQENKKSDDENKQPVIAGIYLDSLDPIDYFFFTSETYTVRADATDPEGGSLTFKWSGDGNIIGEDINPMTWTAPDSEGVYKITVEVTDEKGGTAKRTADVYVNLKSVVVEPPKGAAILDIEIVGSGGDGKYYRDTAYMIQVTVDDPLNEIAWYHYAVNVTGFAVSAATDWCSFRTPDTAGDIDIVVGIADKDDNIIDEKTKTIYIEP